MHDLECVNHGQLFIRQSRGDTLKPVGRNEALTNAWSVLPDWLIAYEHVICPFTCMQSCSVSNSWNVRWCQGEINRRDLVREASLSGSRIGASISSFDGMLVSLERESVWVWGGQLRTQFLWISQKVESATLTAMARSPCLKSSWSDFLLAVIWLESLAVEGQPFLWGKEWASWSRDHR